MKVQKIFYPVVNAVIRMILVLIVAGMLLQSLFSTSFIGTITAEDGVLQERTLNIADDPWRHFIVFAVFTVLGVLFSVGSRRLPVGWTGKNGLYADDSVQEANCARMDIWRICRILSAFVLLSGSLWILLTQLRPGSDPAKIYEIAMQWRKGNFSAYAEGGYLFRYPYQAGIILFYYFLSFLFGVDNYVGLQLVNVIALALIYLLLVKLAAFYWKKDDKLPVFVYVALILWLPLAFYVTYLYGILPGMALSLGAMYCVAKYLDTGKYRHMIPACLCMGLATVIKMNCVIFLIAIGCFLVYDAIVLAFGRDEKLLRGRSAVSSLVLIGLMVLSVMGCNAVSNRYAEYLSGYKAGEGHVMLSWVVMGLQETPLGPGGYSGYIGDIYVKYGYDTEKVKEASWTDIKKVMKRMSENPLDEGVTFFARKNAFQWNDPSFISLDRTKGRVSAIEMPTYVTSLIEGRGSVVFYIVMNYMQSLLWLGMLLYLIINWKSKNLYELMGAVVFLGGFLFHFIWESSASYTIPYFVVMIPYGVKGLADWVRYVCALPAFMADNRRGVVDKKELVRKVGAPACGFAVAVVCVALLSKTNLFYRTFALDDGEEARAQFYQEDEWTPENVCDGYYYLMPYTAQDRVVIEQDGEVQAVPLSTEADGGSSGADGDGVFVPKINDIEQKLLLNRASAGNADVSGVSMRFRSNEQVLAAKRDGGQFALTVYLDDGMNMFYEAKDNICYLWNLFGSPETGYYIVIDDMALTYRDGEVTLEELAKTDEQRWVLCKDSGTLRNGD